MDIQNQNSISVKTIGWLPFIIVGLASTFFIYDFFLRVMPSAMTQELMHEFHIDAFGLGLLSSLFFFSYTPMQLPAGMLFDRYGPRVLMTITMFLCAVSLLVFALTYEFWLASVARLFMGIGSAFAYVGTLLLASRWFPGRYYSFIVGLIQFMGSLGAIIGEGPISQMIHKLGDEVALTIVALVGFALTVLFGILLRDHPQPEKDEATKRKLKRHHHVSEWKRLTRVCRDPQNWAVGVYCFFCWAPISVFAALWGVPYVISVFHISEPHAAMDVSTIWIGVALGGPLLGWWSNMVHSRRIPMILASVVGLFGTLCILYVYYVPEWLMDVFFFMLGTAGSAQAVGFGNVKDNNPPERAGTAAGLNNMLILMGGALLQPLVGKLLSYGWTGTITPSGVHLYPIADYQSSLLVMPICYFAALIISVFVVRETHCEITYRQRL